MPLELLVKAVVVSGGLSVMVYVARKGPCRKASKEFTDITPVNDGMSKLCRDEVTSYLFPTQ